jgi:thiol-disulfide isomerase/thioredoxin
VYNQYSWCKPCHKIQPFYEQCSSQYAEKKFTFLTIDVDNYDEIATTYNVAMMPTFLVLKGETVLGKYAGSNEHELQRFLKEHLD